MVGHTPVIGKILGSGSIIGLATALAIQAATPNVPVMIVPTINLVAIVTGAIAMGMLINRVKELERRMNKIQDKVFNESAPVPAPWDGHERRATEGRRRR